MPSDDPALDPAVFEPPAFEPPWWLRNPHLQTILPTFVPRPVIGRAAVVRRVELPDGDALAVHDDRPEGWVPGGRAAILSHGLADDHRTPLLVRLTDKLNARGVRVFRWDMRACGAGVAWARHPYHAGCSRDLAAVVAAVIGWCRGADDAADMAAATDQATAAAAGTDPELTLFGVSLSGNVLLKYLGEESGRVPAAVRRAVAVNPPIDLVAGIESLGSRVNRVYDRHFTGVLVRHLEAWWRERPDAFRPAAGPRPRTLRGFDEWFTAPALGYRDAAEYYRHASAKGRLPEIRTPTTIITSRDDPLVPFAMFAAGRAALPDCVRLVATDHGGHVGFVGRKGVDPDARWLDWRVVEIVTGAASPARHS